MILSDIIHILEAWAPKSYQESYDNSGLLVGDSSSEIQKALIALDCTESVVDEAIASKCNLIIAHHPIIFGGVKKLTGANYIQRTIIKAIKHDIAIFAIHTNLDNIHTGVNAMIAKKLGLKNSQILSPKKGNLKKIVTFIPKSNFKQVSQALFDAGAGNISNYSECGFSLEGKGSFKGNEYSNPQIGKQNKLEIVDEIRFEVIFNSHLENKILTTLKTNHPYEEVAFDIYTLDNIHNQIGSGMIGELEHEMTLDEFLKLTKTQFNLKTLKHSSLNKPVKKIAVCGGSGSFLRFDAMAQGADVFISSDFKYHEWFDAEDRIVYVDIGHYESEQFTKELIFNYLSTKAVSLQSQISGVDTNPVKYYI